MSLSPASSSRSLSPAPSRSPSLEIPSLLPLSHAHPLLSSPNWNVDTFLLSRLHIPLDELRSELRGYLGQLRGELGELINEDYEEFIGMGMGLRGEGGRLEGLERPLRGVRKEVEKVQSTLTTSQETLQSLLSTRSSLRNEKQLLSLLLHLSESLSRVESLLRIPAPVETEDRDEGVEDVGAGLEKEDIERGREAATGEGGDSKLISRIANEYTQLVYLIEEARRERCDFVNGIESRMTKINHTLHHDLSTLFLSTLNSLTTLSSSQPPSSSSSNFHSQSPLFSKAPDSEREEKRLTAQLQEVLKVYVLVEGWREAEEVVRGLIKPRLAEIITLQALTLPASPPIPQTPFTPSLLPPSTPSSNLVPPTPTVAPPTPLSGGPGSANIFDKTLIPQTPLSGKSFRGQKPAGGRVDEQESGGGGLGRVYNLILGLVEREWRPLLLVAERVCPSVVPVEGQESEGEKQGEEGGKGKRRFGFLEDVIWKETGERVMGELGGVVFAAGRSGDLHKNYSLSHQFLTLLESLSPSLPPVLAIRKSATYEAFEKRWQLPVYFQLRWKEVVGGLEDGLAGNGGGVVAQAPFQLPQTASTLHALKQCWAPGIYIPELSHRFWRLSLQILARYKGWLEKGLGTVILQTSQKPTASGTSAPGQTATGDPSTDPAALAAEETLLRTATVVATDLRLLEREVRALWEGQIWELVGRGMGVEGRKVVEAALEKSLRSLSALFKPASTQIVSILTRRCTDVLKLVRSVASQFRAAAPPAAGSAEKVAASHFVGSILKPLKDYFGKSGMGAGLREEFGEEWSRSVFDEVVSGYTNILITVRKTEDLVRRVRKGKKSAFSLFSSSSAQSGMSAEEEDERFKRQMLMDVETLGREAQDLGLDPVAATAGGKEGGWQGLLEVAAGDSSRTTA